MGTSLTRILIRWDSEGFLTEQPKTSNPLVNGLPDLEARMLLALMHTLGVVR